MPRLVYRIPAEIVAIIALGFVTGCASTAGTTTAASRQVVVMSVIDDGFFVGFAQLGADPFRGTLEMISESRGVIRCSGDFQAATIDTGKLAVRCSGGLDLDFNLSGLAQAKGYGYGKTSRGIASLTFGLSVAEAEKYLLMPATVSMPATVTMPETDAPRELKPITEAAI
jgi:hypothetical protein